MTPRTSSRLRAWPLSPPKLSTPIPPASLRRKRAAAVGRLRLYVRTVRRKHELEKRSETGGQRLGALESFRSRVNGASAALGTALTVALVTIGWLLQRGK